MPKIRGVKPDYWTDEDIVDLSIPARLLFIGLWTFACDNGHLQDKPKQIKMRIFPGDDVNATELLRELAASGRITRGDGWITVPNLTEHQRVDVRYFTTCDKEGCEDPPQKVSQRESRRVHAVHTTSTPRAPVEHTSSARGDGDGDGDGDLKVKGTNPLVRAPRSEPEGFDRFDEFWETYGKKADRKGSIKKWREALRKPGVTADMLIASAAAYVLWERTHNHDGQFIMGPTKWLLNERWTDERPARAPAAGTSSNMQAHMRLVEQTAREHGDVRPLELGGAS